MTARETMLRLLAAVAVGVLVAPSGGARYAVADDFRIDNAVYVADQAEPSSQSTTVFHNGTVYDFLETPAETVVFDKSAGRFVLLNMATRARAELTTNEVAAFVDRIQPLALKSRDPAVKFLAEPKFQERFDEATGELTLYSPWVSYRLTFVPEANAEAVEQYREFSDWYARLNALLVPGSRPPFGRLVVNAAFAQRKSLPGQVVLTLSPGKPGSQSVKVRSMHQLVRPLTESDVDRVGRARESMKTFKVVSFDQYRKAFGERARGGK